MRLLLLLLLPLSGLASKIPDSVDLRTPHYWAKQRKVAVQSFIGGWFNGENDFLRNNFEYYQDRWKHTNPQWSNPRLSANNKYKNGNKEEGPAYTILGLRSTHALSFTTDKWHLNEFLDIFFLAGAAGVSVTLYNWPKGIGFWRAFGRVALEGFIVHSFHSLGKYCAFKFYQIPNN